MIRIPVDYQVCLDADIVVWCVQVSPEVYGEYQCKASNSSGEVWTLDVAEASPPSSMPIVLKHPSLNGPIQLREPARVRVECAWLCHADVCVAL